MFKWRLRILWLSATACISFPGSVGGQIMQGPCVIRLWPGGRVPYVIDPSLKTLNDIKKMPMVDSIARAIDAWKPAGIKFVPCVESSPGLAECSDGELELFFVRFIYKADVCNSPVGYRQTGQNVNLGTGCLTPLIVHEIGHALGLIHEHNRYDRKNYIDVLPNNMTPLGKKQFIINQYPACVRGRYDFASIMHYPADVRKNNKFFVALPVFKVLAGVSLPPGVPNQQAIGSFPGPSPEDLAKVREAYGFL